MLAAKYRFQVGCFIYGNIERGLNNMKHNHGFQIDWEHDGGFFSRVYTISGKNSDVMRVKNLVEQIFGQ